MSKRKPHEEITKDIDKSQKTEGEKKDTALEKPFSPFGSWSESTKLEEAVETRLEDDTPQLQPKTTAINQHPVKPKATKPATDLKPTKLFSTPSVAHESKIGAKDEAEKPDTASSLADSGASSASEDGGVKKALNLNGSKAVVKVVEQDEGWTELTPDTDKTVVGLASSGFSNCFLFICQNADKSHIALVHSSLQASDEESSSEYAIGYLKKKIGLIESADKKKVTRIIVGIDKKSFEEDLMDEQQKQKGIEAGKSTADQHLSKKNLLTPSAALIKGWDKSFAERYLEQFEILRALEKEFGAKVEFVNLVKSSAFIDRDGNFLSNIDSKVFTPDKKYGFALQPEDSQENKSGENSLANSVNLNSSGEEGYGGVTKVIESEGTDFLAESGQQDSYWVKIGSKTSKETQALCASGLFSCFTIIVKTANNSYIYLTHVSSADYVEKINEQRQKILFKEPDAQVQIKIIYSPKNHREGLNEEAEVLIRRVKKKGRDEKLPAEEIAHQIKEIREDVEKTLKKRLATIKDLKRHFGDMLEAINSPDGAVVIDRDGIISITEYETKEVFDETGDALDQNDEEPEREEDDDREEEDDDAEEEYDEENAEEPEPEEENDEEEKSSPNPHTKTKSVKQVRPKNKDYQH